MTRDYQAYFAAANYVNYLEVGANSAAVALGVEGGNIVTFA